MLIPFAHIIGDSLPACCYAERTVSICVVVVMSGPGRDALARLVRRDTVSSDRRLAKPKEDPLTVQARNADRRPQCRIRLAAALDASVHCEFGLEAAHEELKQAFHLFGKLYPAGKGFKLLRAVAESTIEELAERMAVDDDSDVPAQL